jgi:hypothetical protein
MNIKKMLAIKFMSLFIILLSFSSIATAEKIGELENPNGFKKLALYLGTGLFDPKIDEPRPGVTGCTGVFCDGEFFQQNIMHRTPAETEEIKNQAKAYYLKQFGIDVDDPALSGRITFDMFMVNPDFQYRVHALSDEPVSGDGWIIRDGGFRLSIIDPKGVALGGNNSGLMAPQGSMMFFGNYNILAADKHGKPKKEIIVFYKSINAGEPLPNGSFVFRCNMFNQQWGEGLGLGTMLFIPQKDGRIRANARNVLTFPPASTETEFSTKPAFDDAAP